MSKRRKKKRSKLFKVLFGKTFSWLDLSILIIFALSLIVDLGTTSMRTSHGMDTYWSNGWVVWLDNASTKVWWVTLVYFFGRLFTVVRGPGLDIIVLLVFISFVGLDIWTTLYRTSHGMDTYWSNGWVVWLDNASSKVWWATLVYFFGRIWKKASK